MKKIRTFFAKLIFPCFAYLFFMCFAQSSFGQETGKTRDNFTDDVKSWYKGWKGNPDTITVFVDTSTLNANERKSVDTAVKRLNGSGCKPKLKVTYDPAKKTTTEVTLKKNPALGNPGEHTPTSSGGKMEHSKIEINPNASIGVGELATHELGHALGLLDTDSSVNTGDAMKGVGSNGTAGNLSKHDSAEIKAAATLAASVKHVQAPTSAIMPGQNAVMTFRMDQSYPPGALAMISIQPVGNPYITVGVTSLIGDILTVEAFFSPLHWSGLFYLDINMEFIPPYEPVSFRGWHYVHQIPVPPTAFECPFMVMFFPDHQLVEWEGLCTYPYPGSELRSVLWINNYVAIENKGGGPYALNLPSGTYTLRLDVDDFKGNSSSSVQTINVTTTGTYNIPTPAYPTIAFAINSLNSGLVPPGAVTFNIDAGYTENGVNLVLNTTLSNAGAPIVFQKNPYQSGANPKLIVSPGSAVATDGGIIIAGTDYVTFNEVDIDASAQSTVEWGYALVKRQAVAPFDGCQHVTINSCNITMNRSNVKSTGIYAANHTATAVTPLLAITATTDALNDCQIDNNVITNAYIGISVSGYTSAPSPYILYDHNNEIGQYGKNTILNFGGANTDTYGIYITAQDQIKIMNDSIVSGTGSTQRVAGITLAGGLSSNAEVSNNYITVISNATTSQNLYGIWNALGSTAALNCVKIHHNWIRNCASTVTTSSAPMYGIFNSATADTIRIYNNMIYGSVLSTTGSQYVIRSQASANNVFINNNAIYNITNNGTGGLTLIHNQSSVTAYIYSNNVYNCTSNGGTVYGIYSSLGNTANIFKNNFYGISSNNGSTASCLVYGINNSSTPTINIYNNFISGLNANMATNNPAICGLYLTGGTANNVYYNTIYLNASSSGSTFGSAAIYAGTTPTTILQNNIFVNVSTPGASGYTLAYRRSSTTIGSYSSTSNNNDFYAGIPGPNNLIFYDGTTPYSAMAAFQAYVSPADAASFSEMPPFINHISAPYDLHLSTGVNTLCESGGIVVSTPSITTDIDGDPRYPNPGYPNNPGQPATNPDVGADEFSGGIISVSKTLNLALFIEGLFNTGTGLMNKVQDCSDGATSFDKFTGNIVDTLSVILAEASDPWPFVYQTHGVNVNTDGSISIGTIPATLAGNYYIVVMHRQGVETWSANPVSFSGSVVSCDLTGSAGLAFGNNLKQVASSAFAIFSGDITSAVPGIKDGYIDIFDNNDVFNQAQIAAYGYITPDLNGDAFVDIFDMALVFNNMQLGVGMITPPNPGKKK